MKPASNVPRPTLAECRAEILAARRQRRLQLLGEFASAVIIAIVSIVVPYAMAVALPW